MHRIFSSLLLCIISGVFFFSCTSSPKGPDSTETGRPPLDTTPPETTIPIPDNRVPDEPSETPVDTLPYSEKNDVDSEDDNEDEYSPGKLNEEIASDGEDAPEPWIAPATVAPDRPSPVQRSSIAAWIRARPLRFSGYGHHTTGRAYETFSSRAQELLYRSYLNQLFADAGIPLEQAATESAIVLTVTPEFQFAENDKNMYGATTLNIELQLESPIGAGTEADATARVVAAEAPVSARTKLYGPMVLSQVSHEDAYLNSLRRINPRPMRRAIDTLRGELADAVAERGVPFSVAPVSDRSDEDVYAVLRSLGVPDKRERIWRLYDSPEAIRTEIAALLSGSLYRFFLNPLTREIRFLYNEES